MATQEKVKTEEVLAELLERCADFDRRLRNIADNKSLSPNAQMQAVALLTTINGGLFAKCAAALKARAGQ